MKQQNISLHKILFLLLVILCLGTEVNEYYYFLQTSTEYPAAENKNTDFIGDDNDSAISNQIIEINDHFPIFEVTTLRFSSSNFNLYNAFSASLWQPPEFLI